MKTLEQAKLEYHQSVESTALSKAYGNFRIGTYLKQCKAGAIYIYLLEQEEFERQQMDEFKHRKPLTKES